MPVLSEEERAQFESRGFVRLARAFSEDQAAAQRDLIWSELRDAYGVIESDRGTWVQPSRQLRRSRDHADHLSMATDRLLGAIDELLGEGAWQRLGPKHWGSVLFTFPNATSWDVPKKTWHWDSSIPGHMEGCGALHLFSLLAPLEPGGGATVFVEGMHHVLLDYYRSLSAEQQGEKHTVHRARVMAGDAWLQRLQKNDPPVDDRRRLFMGEGGEIGGHHVRVNEMTGEAGDVYILHPLLTHTWAPNASDRPRMMRSKQVTRKDFDWSYMIGEVAG